MTPSRLLSALILVLGAATLLAAAATVLAQPPSAVYVSPFAPAVTDNLRALYSAGRAAGMRGGVFSKVGDSITVNYAFMHPLGWGTFDLGAYTDLQPVIDHFHDAITDADGGTSFTRDSRAADVGWSAWGALEPALVDPEAGCLEDETPLDCEYRQALPAFALIMFGTNDASYRSVAEFRADMERIVQTTLDWGIIPILSTIPMRPEIPDVVAVYNAAIAELTADYRLPLWDYAYVMASLPNFGLARDNLHPSSPPSYRPQEAAIFTPEYLQYGYNVRNLTALQLLDAVWRTVDPDAS